MSLDSLDDKSLSVLVVEDDYASRLALVGLLGTLGFDIFATDTLSDARTVLTCHTPHIVILDLRLRDGDGTALLAEIRESGSPIIVAVVTSITSKLRLHEVTAPRPDALFGDPIDVDDFKVWLLKQLSECSDLSRVELRSHHPPRRVTAARVNSVAC